MYECTAQLAWTCIDFYSFLLSIFTFLYILCVFLARAIISIRAIRDLPKLFTINTTRNYFQIISGLFDLEVVG